MPGIYGDLRNLALNAGYEFWNQATVASTSQGQAGNLWVMDLGTGSTYIASRASTGQDTGTFCAGINYTHSVVSGLHQVAAVLADMKGETISFSVRVSCAVAQAVYPYISTDGGTTKTYGQPHSGAGGTAAFETLKIEGVAVPSTATAVWYGLEFRKTMTPLLVDSACLTLGSAAETDFGPLFGKSAAWTQTSGASVRDVDMSGTATTLVVQALGTLVRDLQNLGILQ